MRTLTGLFLTALFATPVSAVPPDGYARSRVVDVAEPGWTATRLGVAASAHLGVDLTVLAPDGRSLKVFRLDEDRGRRSVQVTQITPASEGGRLGRWIEFDVGADPPRHLRLEFIVGERVEAPDCVLQVRTDSGWRELTRGGLFRLGDDATLQRLAFDYPATDARRLRLFWPQSAGTPALQRVSVLAEGVAAESTVVAPDCSIGDDRRVCTLRLPAPPRQARRLDLTLDGAREGTLAWRLWSAQNGSWRQVSEGVRQSATRSDAGSRVVRVSLDREDRWKLLADAENPTLRLELWGDDAPPVLAETTLWAARPAVAFDAKSAGRHVVAWGSARPHGAFGDPEDDPSRGVSLARLAWVEAGPLETAPWPAIDARLAAPGKELDAAGFSSSWAVDLAGVAAGDVVRLDLGDLSARTDPNHIRLSAGGKLLPFVEHEVDEPELVLSARFRPEAEPGSDLSHDEITGLGEVPPGDVVYSQLLLRAPGPFRRDVSLGYTLPGRRGRPPEQRFLMHRQTWQCFDPGPLPCVLDEQGSLLRTRDVPLELRVDDGDDVPLPWVALEAWRPRAALLFVAPPGKAGPEPARVTLHLADVRAGDPRPGSPRFDLKSVSGLLRLRPHSSAVLGTDTSAEPSSPVPVGWLLYGSIAVAVLVLLALLGRMLREPPAG